MSATHVSRHQPLFSSPAPFTRASNPPPAYSAQPASPSVAPSPAVSIELSPIALPAPARLAALRLPQLFGLQAEGHNANDVCPITRVSIRDIARPYLAQDGYLYDRTALAQWCLTSQLSPMTREPMPATCRELLGYTGELRRQARKAGRSIFSPQGLFAAIVTGGVVAGAVVGPTAMLLYNRNHDFQISPTLVALSAPLGAAVVGFICFGAALPLGRSLQRLRQRRQPTPIALVGV